MKRNCQTMSKCLLLTACVNPSGMTNTVLQDQNARLQQYKKSLEWYIENCTIPIVFVENTGFDISTCFEESVRSGRLEVLSFEGNSYDKMLGKGYGEALIIDYAIKHSKVIGYCSTIVKVTGMFICSNIQTVIRSCNRDNTVYAPVFNDRVKGFMCMSRLFVAPKVFLEKYFLPYKEEIDDRKVFYFEHLLYRSVGSWKKDGYSFNEFWFPVLGIGMSGTSGDVLVKSGLNNFLSFYSHRIAHLFGYYGSFGLK